MADSAHYVYAAALPGVKSIIRQYRRTGVSTWIDLGANDRIMPGLLVKYTVVPLADFEITTNNLFYVGDYGVTVEIPKDNVPDENAWIFTMPNQDVTIQCGASGTSGGGGFPDYVASGSYQLTGLMSLADYFDGIIDIISAYPNYNRVESFMPTMRSNFLASMSNDSGNAIFGYFNFTSYNRDSRASVYCNIYVASDVVGDIVTLMASGSKQAIHSYTGRVSVSTSGVPTYTDSYSSSGTTVVLGTNIRYCAGLFDNYTHESVADNYVVGGTTILIGDTPSTSNTIQYILSPSDSGEVDGPETYSDNSFSFDYKIKTAYEFKRIRVFAVGEVTGSPPVPREESISDVTETYDGDTRTYTFTVSNIPDWAIGVRCVIETIYLLDNESAGGTNNSDGPVGGNGTFDDTSDEVPLPAIPAGISAADSGFVTLFRPTIEQIKNLGDYLWSHLDEFIENLQKMFTNPMDYFIAFNIMPVSPPVGTTRNIYIGNWISNIPMPPVLNQFYEYDCGTVTISEYFGSFLDYAPNTKARIMLPFIGDRDLDVNEIMGKTLHLWYRIDLLSGACVAVLTINNSVYYQWSGNCAVGIPVTASDWSTLYSAISRVALVGAGYAIGGAGMAATTTLVTNTPGGAAQGAAVADLARRFESTPKGVPGVARDRQAILNAMENVGQEETRSITSHTSRAISGSYVGSMIGYNAAAASPRVQHTGDMSGAISIMGNRTPYIVLEYPNVNLPENFKHFVGYPSNQYVVLSSVRGYTKAKAVIFESTRATDDEIEMVISALKGGVYL